MRALQIRHAAVAMATLLVMAACETDSSTAPAPVSVVGTFALQSVNGSPLPYSVVDSIPGQGQFTVEIMSPSSLSVNADKSFRFVLTVRTSFAGSAPLVATETVMGTYTVAGTTMSMTANGETLTAQWDGSNTLTLGNGTEIMVFKR